MINFKVIITVVSNKATVNYSSSMHSLNPMYSSKVKQIIWLIYQQQKLLYLIAGHFCDTNS